MESIRLLDDSRVCNTPTVLGVSPSSGTGLSQQSFTAAFSDTSGAGDILQAHLLFNLGLNGTNACWLIYYSGSFYLMNDGQTAWEGPLAPNSGGSFSNSQCTLFGTGSSITRSGNTFSMTVTVTFNANFWGTMASFMNAGSEEGDSSGWSQAGAWTVPVISSSVAALQNCITSSGPSDVGPKTCILTASSIPYQVTSASTLTIARSNLIITGSGTPGETILVRDSASVGAIMTPSSTSITNVTISNLTFDGNRYGPGLALNCLAGNNDYTDLDLDFGGLPQGSFTVQWVDFINGPGDSLHLSGGSTVSVSNFGQGGYGIGPSGSLGSETAIQAANRSTAVWVDGSGGGASYNAVAFAGTAAITINGSAQAVLGNLLQQNRYELSDVNPDGSVNGGGQLVLNPGSSSAVVAGNVINGNYWPNVPGGTQLATNCYLGSGTANNSGIEGYGAGHQLYNNEVEQNLGSGIVFPGILNSGTEHILISSANPRQSNDSPRYIEANAEGGIVFLGPMTNSTQFPTPAQGVILDDVLVRGNALTAVVLDGVQNASVGGVNYYGFTYNACLSAPPGYLTTAPLSWNTLVSPTPTNYAEYTGALGPLCPTTSWSFQVPAPSHTPGWSW